MVHNIQIRECETVAQLADCVQLQRDVFALPETELSPVRHFIVTKNAGGFTLGAFDGDRLAGFVLSVPAMLRGENAFYSHMAGVRSEYQSHGIGALLKWAQRERALSLGVRYIKWTFEPVKARNAYFNLEKLGAIVREYEVNFYGIDYSAVPEQRIGLASDRLFAEWQLDTDKVRALAAGEPYTSVESPDAEIVIMNDWATLLGHDPKKAVQEQLRIRDEFLSSLEGGLIARSFRRDNEHPAFQLFSK